MNAFQQMFPWRQIKLLKAFYTRQPFYIYRRDIFYLKSAKIFRKGLKTFRRLPKMLRRVPSNTNTGTQRNIDFPTNRREFGESRSSS